MRHIASGGTRTAVGAKATRPKIFAAIKPGGVIMPFGVQDWASEIDMRKLTLAEIPLLGPCPRTTADRRANLAALYGGRFGDLAWIEVPRLVEGA